MRLSPGNCRSRPPFRKYVTWAYFSVSAMRSCVSPARLTTSPRVSSISSGPNTVGRRKSGSYSVIAETGNVPSGLRKPSNLGSASARDISRARSARKFHMKKRSPGCAPSYQPTSVGRTNSSSSPAA